METLYEQTATPMQMRSRGELELLLADVELVEPGVEFLPAWRPDHPDDVGGDASWASGVRRGGSAEVTAAARPDEQPVPLRGAGAAGAASGSWPRWPGRPATSRWTGTRSTTTWTGVVGELVTGAVGRSRSARPRRTSSAATWSPPTSPARRSPAGWSRCSAPGCCRTVGLDREPYRSRLAALLGAATTGYARALRDRALDDQETIVRASMIARAEAERALRDSEERALARGPARPADRAAEPARPRRAAGPACSTAAGRPRHGRALRARPGPVPRAERHARAGRGRPAAGHGRVRLSEHAGGRLLARLGGDEFALVVAGRRRPGAGRDDAAGRAGRGAAAGRADAADRDRERRADRAAGGRDRRSTSCCGPPTSR